MLEDFLRDIYEKAMTLELVKEASFYSKMRHIYNRMNYWNEASPYLEKILFDLKETDIKKGAKLLESIQKVQQSFVDWHAFSASIDEEVVPVLSDYLSQYTGIDVTDGEWTLESSKTGFLTVKSERTGYLHSPSDPMWESFLYAYSIFDPEAKQYYILGGGLGYLAYQLWRMSSGDADIYIFEIEKELAAYAENYGVLDFITRDKLHVVTGDDTDSILEQYTKSLPGVKTVKTMYHWDLSKYKGEYANYFRIQMSNEVTGRAVEHTLRRNFDSNIKLDHKNLSELNTDSFKDEWVVVGAGPSLNDNADFIKESVGKRTICAINASLKWFSRHEIRPDLCTALDPLDLLIPHIEGLEEFSKDVPLVMDCVTNRTYAQMYKGPRYYIYSTATALTIGKENVKGDIWVIGGTVVSMAIDLAYRMGAKKIYLIGADLAYPDGVTFADGVGHDVGKWKADEETVVSVDDKIIPTSIKFNEYRGMIEDQIAEYKDVEVINRSLHGAYFAGTFCNKWWEDLPSGSGVKEYIELFDKLKSDSFLLDWKKKYYIFRQIIAKMEAAGISGSDIDSVACSAYEHIYDQFGKAMNWESSSGVKRTKGLTYVFTNEYTDHKDAYSRQALIASKNELKKKQNVLVVNTADKFGGEKVAMHDSITGRYSRELDSVNELFYENASFPYFQFPEGMPNLKICRAFLDSVSDSIPDRLVVVGKYNLLADYFKDTFNIPVNC